MQHFRYQRRMGHAFEHCKFKNKSKIKRFGEKNAGFWTSFFFIDTFLLSRAVPAGEHVETRFHAGRTSRVIVSKLLV